MTATLLISFDCEGRFGVADRMDSRLEATLTNAGLDAAYAGLLELLDVYRLKATFAFVGAFTLTKSEWSGLSNRLMSATIRGREWLQAFHKDFETGEVDGWLNPTPFNLVKARPDHEISSHGFSHVPLAEQLVSRDVFTNEMELIREVGRLKACSFKTFVYPRNLIGYSHLLPRYGFVGFRGGSRYAPSLFGRLQNLLEEFNPLSRPQADATDTAPPVTIPSGFFLNCDTGTLRGKIPAHLTVNRWHSLLRRAAQSGGVVHLWSHPENFTYDPSLLSTLEQILKVASDLCEHGQIENRTLWEYCRTQYRK